METTKRIGNYDDLALLGEGGAGTVHKAQDRDTGEVVAVKIMPSDLARNPVLRRRFEEELTEYSEYARRYNESGAVLLLDLDRFKYVNDTHGHKAGDEVIRAVGVALRDSVRGSDVVARLGGDEFAVLLKNVHRSEAERVAALIVEARQRGPLERTGDLARLLLEGRGGKPWRLHPKPGRWELHPAARTFQALRILVNRELANLEQLLRSLSGALRPGGVAAVISFHSGEDRLVKAAFRAGLHAGAYAEVSPEPVRATEAERAANPRSRSAKLRWARAT